MRGGVVVELQRSCDGFEHLLRRLVAAALLQARLVVGTDSRQRGELLATEPGHATPITVRDADVFGIDLRAPCPKELSELMGSVHRCRSYRRMALAYLGTLGSG